MKLRWTQSVLILNVLNSANTQNHKSRYTKKRWTLNLPLFDNTSYLMSLFNLRQLRPCDSGIIQQILIKHLPFSRGHHLIHLFLRRLPSRHLQLPDNEVLATLLLGQQTFIILQNYLHMQLWQTRRKISKSETVKLKE